MNRITHLIMHLELYKSKGINPRTDEFTFSCLQSTSFPWQVYLFVCTVNKFSLTSLLSRVYSRQVFLDKFTFSCVRYTSSPWQVYFLVCTVNKFSLTSFVATACKHLFYVKPAFILVVFLYTCQVFLVDRIPDEQIFLSKTCCEYIPGVPQKTCAVWFNVT
jgi:hypothetical protein